MYIDKIILHPLVDSSYDRRGTIATIVVEEAPNMDYMLTMAGRFIWRLTSVLCNTYRPSEDWDSRSIYNEGNNCTLCISRHSSYRGRALQLGHKYWSQAQVDAFRTLIKTLAPICGWEIQDEVQ